MVRGSCDGSKGVVVPYSESSILKEFHENEKTVLVSGRKYMFVQKWNDNGVSGVLWDSAIVLANYLAAHPDLVLNLSVLELGAGLGLEPVSQAIVLANYLAAHPDLVLNLSVLELGAGLGLPSIVACDLGARYVAATDQPLAVPLLAENIRRNSRSNAPIEVFPLDWQTDRPAQPYQVVLGADLVYNPQLFAPLSRTMKRSSDSSTLILFSSRIRYPKDEKFYTDLTKQGFVVRKQFYDNTSDIHVFHITAADAGEL
ncbi:Protein N-lysine methyltransferase METTL21A [Toxocara canis]|uniref:Protein N-lysine methyltransferase METTL21A n=1 Tax=Toxocara canis TaxID=6265 RepID=A0A0B2VWG7_TOXCA|nr:Protein N-lysine methyltransferase METTL21A [Toxocara canis]